MMNRMETPKVGTKVLTMDGDDLGKVKEISGDCFKVDAPMQPDYWLGIDMIADATPTEVHLRFTKDGLGEAKMDGPGHAGLHSHSRN